jgi:hypothetical protein
VQIPGRFLNRLVTRAEGTGRSAWNKEPRTIGNVPGEKSKMVSVSLNNVIVPSHLEWRVQGEDQLLFEIYTGNLIVQFPGGDTTKRDTYSTYLPLSVDPDGSVNIRTYGTDDALPTINSAIVVTPAGASLEKDKTTVSVDS